MSSSVHDTFRRDDWGMPEFDGDTVIAVSLPITGPERGLGASLLFGGQCWRSMWLFNFGRAPSDSGLTMGG